jgi:hypothetical protein
MLKCVISSFRGHQVTALVVGRQKAKQILLDGKSVKKVTRINADDGVEKLELHFSGTDRQQILTIKY